MKHTRRHRRHLLALLAVAALGAPPAASGCGTNFAPVSELDGFRVLAVAADEPYAHPGDRVTFTMTYEDASPTPRPVQVLWLGGCVNPPGDEYYGCYAQFGPAFAALKSDPSKIPPGVSVGFGDTFSIDLPQDLVSSRPAPSPGSPKYGIAYVFFAACAGGTVKPLTTLDSGGLAGSFPFECVDAQGNRLGADSFVPGYTQVYAFADGRLNLNPVVTGFTVERTDVDAAVTATDTVPTCSVSEADRNANAGCGHTDPFDACTDYQISVVVPNDVAEPDTGGTHEVVWVDYFADRGNVQDPTLLVSDATSGVQQDFSTTWIAPPTPGTATLWAVVHDSRGGETVVERQIVVK